MFRWEGTPEGSTKLVVFEREIISGFYLNRTVGYPSYVELRMGGGIW